MGNRELFHEKSPKELLVEFQQSGANAPFEEIMRRYAAMVYGVCLRVTGDKHDAEDATQAVFLSLALQAKTSREITYVGPWLQKVAHRLALDVKKSKTRRKRREEKLADQARHTAGMNGNGNGRFRGQSEGAMGGGAFGGGNGHLNNPADAPGAQELKQIMMEELNQLPAKYRMPLVMHYFGGLSRDEMSEQLKCNPSTLGVRVHRGKAMLGTRLAKRGIAISAIAMAVLLEHVIKDSATMPIIGSASIAAGNGFLAGNHLGVMIASAKVSHLIRTAARVAWFAKTRYGIVAMLVMGWAAIASGSANAVVQQIRNHLPSLDFQNWITPLFKSLIPAPRADAGDLEFARTPSAEPEIHVDLDRVLGAPPSELAYAAGAGAPMTIAPARQATPVATEQDDPRLNDLARAILEPPSLLPPVVKQNKTSTDSTIGSDNEEIALAEIPSESRAKNFYLGAGGGGGIGGKPDVYTLPANGSLHSHDQIIGDTGFGIFRQEGGINRVDGTLTLGNQKGSVGRYELLAGTIDAKQEVIGNEGSATFIMMNGVNRVQNSIVVGATGDGTVDHRGGTTTVANTGSDGGIAMAVNPGSKAAFNLSGGDVWATPQNIGVGGDAVVVQTDGTNHTNTIVLANENGSSGIYRLDGGQIRLEAADAIASAATAPGTVSAFYDSSGVVPASVTADPASQVNIGGKGDALFSLGTTNSTGAIIENNSKASFVIRGRPSASGSLVGWGTVDATGTLTNNGQVGADGHRQQRTLDLTHFSAINNTIENPAEGGTSGWFARRKGELALPGVRVLGGDGTYTWGEDPLDPVIDLVNSVRFGIDNAEHGGDVFISLLSPLRDDIPTLPAGHKFIGVWKFDGSRLGGFDGVDLQVRYDDAMAADLGMSENLLKLWRYDDAIGQWQRINDDSFYRDTVSHLISGRSAGSLDYFAVSAPEPGVSVLAIVGAAALLKRRRRLH